MTTNRVKHVSLLLIALAALFIVGCAATPATTAPTTQVTEEPTEMATEAPTPTEEPTEVATEAATEAATEEMTEEPTVEATQEVGPPTESEASEDTTGTTLGTSEDFAGFGPILLGVIDQVLDIDLETEEFTVFIPSTDAAAALDTTALMGMTEDAEAASAFAGCYVAEGSWTPDMFEDGATVTMLSGDEYTVVVDEDGTIWLTAEGVDNVRLDSYTATANGVIYLIDGLLCTPDSE